MGLVIYNGPSAAGVDVWDEVGQRYVHCPKGQSVLVSDALEAALLIQGSNWTDGGDGSPDYTPPPRMVPRDVVVYVDEAKDATYAGKVPVYDGARSFSLGSVESDDDLRVEREDADGVAVVLSGRFGMTAADGPYFDGGGASSGEAAALALDADGAPELVTILEA